MAIYNLKITKNSRIQAANKFLEEQEVKSDNLDLWTTGCISTYEEREENQTKQVTVFNALNGNAPYGSVKVTNVLPPDGWYNVTWFDQTTETEEKTDYSRLT